MMVFFKSLDIDSEDNCTSNWLKIDDGNSTSNRGKAGKLKNEYFIDNPLVVIVLQTVLYAFRFFFFFFFFFFFVGYIK